MRLDGYGLFVKDMATMIRFYRDVLGFKIKEDENTDNVYLLKDGTLFLLYGRKDFVLRIDPYCLVIVIHTLKFLYWIASYRSAAF